MRVAITGATGLIGSELVRSFLDRGDEVISIVRPNSDRGSNMPSSPRLKIIRCDISNYKSLQFKERCDLFYHLAWMKTFGTDRDDVRTQLLNMGYSIDAIDLAGSWGAKAFVGAGSQAEYGNPGIPLNESTPINPSSGYGIAKYGTGRLCKLYCEQKGLRFNWARILSVYGENDASHTLIMYLINTMLDGKQPDLTNCEQIWDYIYVKDCASALIAIGDKGVNGRTYCIGSGSPKPLKEYVEVIRNLINPQIRPNYGVKDYYPHQVMYLCADISDLKKDTGFLPQYSFEEGISNVIEHARISRAL